MNEWGNERPDNWRRKWKIQSISFVCFIDSNRSVIQLRLLRQLSISRLTDYSTQLQVEQIAVIKKEMWTIELNYWLHTAG